MTELRPHPVLRHPALSELGSLSQLCLRSKAYWGYNEAFMAACAAELTLTENDLQDEMVVLEDENGLAGLAQVSFDQTGCYLEKLFVDPARMGRGYGRVLYEWAVATARRLGATEMIIDADPDAAPFYTRMGGVRAGEAPSGSVAGRTLPRFVHPL
ncbi:MAG: GNAT family N-acetyltransferase [Henriciella sp.]